MDPALIEQSFDIAAERCADITPLVYARLFSQHPEMEPLFVRDKTGSVRGEMLYQAIEALLDFAGPRSYGHNFMRCEIVTHEGYGVPRDLFAKFYDALCFVLHELAQSDWTPAMDASWRELLAEISALVEAEPVAV